MWPAAACLVSELARELLALAPAELQAARVVLPTKRLKNWLLALVAQERPAFVAPRFYNLDEFLATLLRETAETDAPEPRAAAPLTLELLLADLLAHGDYRHLGPGHAHEIQQLLAEAAEWGLRDTLFARLEEAVARDVVRSEEGLTSLSERFRELDDVAAKLDATLAASGEETPEGQTRRRCEAVAARLLTAQRLPGAFTYVVGFSSLGGHHQTLLAALADLPNVAVWMNEPPPLASGKNPLALLRAVFPDDVVTVRVPTVGSGKGALGEGLAVFRADTVRDEVDLALALVEEALAKGVAPSHIAVLVTSEPDYGVPLLRALAKRTIPYNAAIALPLAATDLGQWLAALTALVDSPDAPAAALDLLAHPLSLARWGAAPRLGRPEVSAMVGELRAPRRFGALAPRDAELGDYVKRVAADLERFLGGEAHGPPRPQPVRDWTEALRQLVAPLTAAAPRGDLMMSAARTALLSFFEEFGRAAAAVHGVASAQNFFRFFAPRALALDVREVGDQLRGVQVLGIAEARYVPFRLAVILGALEGCFPRALPKDHLVDHWLKTKVGLPGWQLLEAIEDTTFHLLASRLPAIALTYPERLGADPAVRSRFVEDLVARRGVTVRAAPRAALKPGPGVPDLDRRFVAQGLVPPGTALGDGEPWSATALEIFICCPYRHLLERLGLKDVELPQADDSRREGDRLHAVLEAFFTGRAAGRTIAGPLGAPETWDRFEEFCVARLADLSETLLPRSYLESAEGLQLRFKAWPAFAAHLKGLYDEASWHRDRRGLREHGFRTDRFKGKIDSVDRLPDYHVVTDYKRGGPPPIAQVRSGVAPQLAVYAAALADGAADETLPLERAVVGYWRILEGAWVGVGAGSAVLAAAKDAKLVPPKAGVEAETLLAAVDGLVAWRRAATRAAGAYVPDPSQCGFCRWQGICRRDDPQAHALFKDRDLLAQRLGRGGLTADEEVGDD